MTRDPEGERLVLPISKQEYEKALKGKLFHYHFHPFNDNRIVEIYLGNSEMGDRDLEPKRPELCIDLKDVPAEAIDWERLESGEVLTWPMEDKPYYLSIATKSKVEGDTGKPIDKISTPHDRDRERFKPIGISHGPDGSKSSIMGTEKAVDALKETVERFQRCPIVRSGVPSVRMRNERSRRTASQ